MSAAYCFTLYVAGPGLRASNAERYLRRVCDQCLGTEDFDIRVVDVLRAVEEADAARILVTPTVVRTKPLPAVRVIGDLAATAEVAAALGLPNSMKPLTN